MKRTSLALTLILVLLVSAIAGTLFVRIASAQPAEIISIKDDGCIEPSTAPSIAWSRTYTDSGLLEVDSLLQTEDGGFLMAGKTSSRASQPTYIELVKVNSLGDVQWNKTYEGIGSQLTKWLVQTSDGNYAIAGEYIFTSQQKVGFWLAKLNPNGDIIWTKTYFGEGFGWAEVLMQTSDGGYALVGPTHADTHIITGEMDIWLLKTDPSGNQQWAKTVGTGFANSIVQTAEGGHALAAYSTSANFQLIETSSNGTVEWAKTFGNQDKATASSVVQTSDGGFAVGGAMWLRSNGGGLNLAVVKTGPSGNEQWTKYYGSGIVRDLLQTSDGGFAIASNPFFKVDAAGNMQWELSLGNLTNVYSVIQTQNGGYAVAGATNANGASEGWMAVIGSTDSTNPTPTPTPEVEPFPASLLFVASVGIALGAVGLLVYFKKRKH
jgi:hypothetical protein